MDIRRFFADKKDKQANQIKIYGSEFKHITKVLRYKVGYILEVVIQDGFIYRCEINQIQSNYILVDILETSVDGTIIDCNIVLYLSLCKKNKLDIIIQKCQEFGISEIKLFKSEYSQDITIKQTRINEILLHAGKQSYKSKLLKMSSNILSFREMLDEINNSETNIFAYEKCKNNSFSDISNKIRDKKDINIIIGSEGGFSKQEADLISKNSYTVSLGNQVFRCETAVIVSLSILLYEKGYLK